MTFYDTKTKNILMAQIYREKKQTLIIQYLTVHQTLSELSLLEITKLIPKQ